MKSLRELIKVENIFQNKEEIKRALVKNPVMLIVHFSFNKVDEMSCFSFRHKSEARSKPLILGIKNVSCGIYQCDTTSSFEFEEVGYLNDTLSCLTAKHLSEELKETQADSHYLNQTAMFLMSYMVKKYLVVKEKQHIGFKGGLTNYKLNKIEDFVKQNISKPISINDLAKISGISTFYFVRMFKYSTGETPYQYIIRHKLHKAKKMLVDTDEKIIQIGFSVGFNDPGHFARVFKNAFGISPSGFRKKMI